VPDLRGKTSQTWRSHPPAELGKCPPAGRIRRKVRIRVPGELWESPLLQIPLCGEAQAQDSVIAKSHLEGWHGISAEPKLAKGSSEESRGGHFHHSEAKPALPGPAFGSLVRLKVI
jgi:hypothetical protein